MGLAITGLEIEVKTGGVAEFNDGGWNNWEDHSPLQSHHGTKGFACFGLHTVLWSGPERPVRHAYKGHT